MPYNGSVARVAFGPVTYARARRWLAEHSTSTSCTCTSRRRSSVSVLALLAAEGPIVVTFHTSTERSRALVTFGGMLRPLMEKVTARIAVSPLARRVQVEHLGGDAVEIPNGVDVDLFAAAQPLPGYPRPETVGFLGRFDEPRKGMPVLLDAVRRLGAHPAGPAGARRRAAGTRPRSGGRPGRWPAGSTCSAPSTTTRRRRPCGRSTCSAPPTSGGESFGMVLTEAMAAGAPVLASDLDAFRAVLGDPAGRGAVPDR